MKLASWIIIGLVALCAGMTGVFIATSWIASAERTPASFHQHLHRNFDLSADQAAKLEEIERRFVVRKVELEARLQAANFALAGAIQKDKTDSPNVEAAIDEFNQAMGELQKVTIEHVFEMREILTSEQALAFDTEVVRALTER